jgi:hypothetical protein
VAQIFTVTCPACGGKFPCHPELWEVPYDLLCPFCQHMFPQAESPLIITGTGERRIGSAARPRAAATPAATEDDPSANAESM